MRHTLLVPKETLYIYPSLAKALGGINLAMIVNAFDRNVEKNVEHDGFQWSCISLENLQKQFFPFWSLKTISRAISKAEKKGLLISMRNPKTHWHGVTKMYRINYDKVNQLLASEEK